MLNQQVSLSEMEQRCRIVFSDLQHKERSIAVVLCDIEKLQNNILSLETQTHNILLENLQLQHSVDEQSENLFSLLAGYSVYRTKLEKFKASACAVERETDVYKRLKEKELQVSKLTQTLDELKEDFQNPEGTGVLQAQVNTTMTPHMTRVKNRFNLIISFLIVWTITNVACF